LILSIIFRGINVNCFLGALLLCETLRVN
jgi:hypothetical protein